MKNLIIVILIFWSILPAAAQEPALADTVIALGEAVVTYQAHRLTPVSHQNIGAQQLKLKSTGQEPSFILSETPSITVYSDAGSTQSYSYFRMRGIDQTRVNITLDGVPLNEPEDQGAYFSNYPDLFNSLDRIQIQRGVGTSQNGVANYAGSIQMFSPRLRGNAQTVFGADYGSYNSLRAYVETQTGLAGNKALYARASEVYSDGYKRHSGNHSQSAFVSGGWYADKAVWKLNIIAGHQQNGMAWLGVPDSLITADRRANANTVGEKDRFMQGTAQLHNTYRLNSRSFLQSAAYYTFLDGNYDFDIRNFSGLPPNGEMYNYALRSHLFGLYTNYAYSSKDLKWVSGLHAATYNRRHTGSMNTAGTDFRNTGYKNDASIFSKLDYRIGRLSLYADVQGRYAAFDYKGNIPLSRMEWIFLNPKAGVSFSANDRTEFYYSIGRVGREPTRTDMFGGNEDLPSDNEGRPDITIDSPEYVVDQELGIKFHNEHINLGVNMYYMDFDNEIVLNGNFGPNGLALTDNVERSYRAGIELSATYRILPCLTLANNSAWNRSRIREQGTAFSPVLTPALIINQEAEWRWRNLSASLLVRYQSRSYIDFANTTAIDGYCLLNVRLGYTFRKTEWNVYLNNLTNAKYYNNGYVDYDGIAKYFVQAPVNFYLSLKYTL